MQEFNMNWKDECGQLNLVLNLLEVIYLRLRNIVVQTVTVVKFGVTTDYIEQSSPVKKSSETLVSWQHHTEYSWPSSTQKVTLA